MSSSSSFGPFLETRDLLSKGASGEPASQTTSRSDDELARSATLYLDLLRSNEFPVATAELRSASGLSFESFQEGLGAMHKAGLITLSAIPGRDETVELTPQGVAFQRAIREAATAS
ncbi:hypothetical protein [Solirubrobacter soli]|uniref:hypothetical protein n=1 Tax=Solirubrobacter soli TaxID=363832 RepID=UPI00040C1634|nr:hypothetical protein [Solirubrobacter soli]